MEFKIFMITSNLLIPIIMVFFGLKFAKRGPKKINGIYGYRTTMSMKNKETWEFAHKYCGLLWKKLGFILLILSAIISIVAFKFNDDGKAIIILILVLMQIVVLIASISPVEKALKKNFDENGNRRS